MRKLCVSIALLTVMAVLTQSNAQQPDPATFKLFGAVGRILGENPASLTRNESVQKELKLDEDQVKAIKEKVPQTGGFGGFGGKGKQDDAAKERFTKYMEKVNALKDVPEDKLEAKIRETFKEEIEGPAKEVEKILKPEQMARLKQIGRQQGGPGAYLKPENVKDLKLTDEQTKKLKDINDELQKDVRELFGAGGKGGFSAETREKMTALNKEAKEKADALLTDEQKSKWKELIGEPFTVQRGGGRPQPKPKKDD